jgi:hypothetical protein
MANGLRFFIDKKIIDGVGGDHSRVIDTAETDGDAATEQVTAFLEPDEAIGSVASIEVNDDHELI